jgi:hypothetical protein
VGDLSDLNVLKQAATLSRPAPIQRTRRESAQARSRPSVEAGVCLPILKRLRDEVDGVLEMNGHGFGSAPGCA